MGVVVVTGGGGGDVIGGLGGFFFLAARVLDRGMVVFVPLISGEGVAYQ